MKSNSTHLPSGLKFTSTMNHRIRSFRDSLYLGLAFLALCAGVNQAQAQWRTQNFDLVEGFNAIYLHVDASHVSIEDIIGDKPITQIWMWNPPASSTQFLTSIDLATNTSSNWLNWVKDEVDDLKSMVGPAAYLVEVSSATTWSIKGKPRIPNYNWNTDGQNFIGFPVPADNEDIVLDNFLGKNLELQNAVNEVFHYIGSDLEASLIVSNPMDLNVRRGEAYWIDADGLYNEYFGPFNISLEDRNGVLFGDQMSQYRVRISNSIDEAIMVTMSLNKSEDIPSFDSNEIVAIDSIPPILIRDAHNTDEEGNQLLTYSYIDLNSVGFQEFTLEPNGEEGSEIEIVLGLNRSALVGDYSAGILTFTDSLGYSEIEVPVSAYKSSSAGLWVGEAEIDRVRNNITFYERDDDGIVYNEDGSIDPSSIIDNDEDYNGVPRAYKQRLIVHIDGSENVRLMQRVYYGVDATDATRNILANSQSYLDSDQLSAARRVSAVHFPWTSENEGWLFTGSLDPAGADLDGGTALELLEVDSSTLAPTGTADTTVVALIDGNILVQVYDSETDVVVEAKELYLQEFLTDSEISAYRLLVSDGLISLALSDAEFSQEDKDALRLEILTQTETFINVAYSLDLDLVADTALDLQEIYTVPPGYTDTTVIALVDDAILLQVYDSGGNLLVESNQLLLETYVGDFENFQTLVTDGFTAQLAGTLSEDQKLGILAAAETMISQAQLVVDVEMDYGDQATNPFLHTYHPDHDNRDAEFSSIALNKGEESYDVKRTIALLLTVQEEDFDSLTTGATKMSGAYAEEITLTGKPVYNASGGVDHYETRFYGVQGNFSLIRISEIDEIQGTPAID
jgi:hypothetical protein